MISPLQIPLMMLVIEGGGALTQEARASNGGKTLTYSAIVETIALALSAVSIVIDVLTYFNK